MSYSYNTSTSARSTSRSSKNANKPWAPQPERPVRSSKPKNGKATFVDNMEKNVKLWYETVPVNALSDNLTYTENGAIAYKSSGKALLDINYQITSMRTMSDKAVIDMFRKAYSESPRLAIRWLFKACDIREGDGERRLFKVCMTDIMNNGGKDMVARLIPLIPEYNRWDMLYTFLGKHKVVNTAIATLIRKQWDEDVYNMKHNKPISLMAKWLKSANSHNSETRKLGLKTASMLEIDEVKYRKTLSALRKYLDVVERKMSSKNWQSINYETVPSKANLIYNKAFLRNDEVRRRSYLHALEKGDAKINSSVVYPHEIIAKYGYNPYGYSTPSIDKTLEGMWKALPNLVDDNGTTLVVADGSGSMCTSVGGGVTALQVATALAIYFAERAKGVYNNKYITFSSRPQFVNFDKCKSLRDKVCEAYKHNEVANTNLSATFDLILNTAIESHASQSDLPKNLLIITDGHFDSMVNAGGYGTPVTYTLIQKIAKKFKAAGYTMPNLIFWNVCGGGRLGSTPISEDDRGIMVGGFSINTLKMVMTGRTNPYLALLDVVMDKRYDKVEEAAF